MYEKTTLDNGLRIVSSAMPHTRSVCVAAFVGTGSRYEAEDKGGISHFIEHLCFKGTEIRPTSKEVCETIEGVGGIINAGTDKELTIYWCKVARPHFRLAVDVLSDILSNSRFDPQDIERERQVIIEEINMSLDSPQQRVDMLIDSLVWPGHPLGRDVAGTKTSVSALTREDMFDHVNNHYLADNTVVAVAGDVQHSEVLDTLGQAFAGWQTKTPPVFIPARDEQTEPRHQLEYRDTEQAHLCLALPGLPLGHPDRFALDLLNVILGEGMSSRLFVEIREKRGLAYAIQSYVNHHLDSGCLTIYAGVDPTQLPVACSAILEELTGLLGDMPEAELHKAKELSKGRLMLRMEDTRSVAGWMGGQELLEGRILTVDDVVSLLDDIGPGDLLRVARGLVVPSRLNLAVVGPVGEEDVAKLLVKG